MSTEPRSDRPENPAGPSPGPDRPLVAAPADSSDREPEGLSPLRNVIEWIAVILGAVLIALVVRNFVMQSFKIPSGSMHPTLIEGDRVLVNRLSYRLHDINRGDVVVFERPPNAVAAEGDPDDLIKRVIGLPGETIEARNGIVHIDGEPLDEPYLPEDTVTTDLDEPVTVPPDEVFVMGDNRSNSSDSRFIGTIPTDTVIGRAFAIIWPLSRFSGL